MCDEMSRNMWRNEMSQNVIFSTGYKIYACIYIYIYARNAHTLCYILWVIYYTYARNTHPPFWVLYIIYIYAHSTYTLFWVLWVIYIYTHSAHTLCYILCSAHTVFCVLNTNTWSSCHAPRFIIYIFSQEWEIIRVRCDKLVYIKSQTCMKC